MLSSQLVWQLFVGCVSVVQFAVLILGAVLFATYVATLWQTRRTIGRHSP